MSANTKYHQTQNQLSKELEIIQLSKIDPNNFEALYRKYYGQIFNYINNRVEEEEIAYDLTSQVFLKALKNIHKYEYRGVPFSSWLYRIAKSEVYQQYRDQKSNRIINVDDKNLNQLATVVDVESDKEENIQKILQTIKKLKPEELTVIELRFFEKRSFKEIAEILYITETNAKVKCFRIISKLRNMIPSFFLLSFCSF